MLYTPEQVVDLTETDDAYSADGTSSREIAVQYGRTPAQTQGMGDCLYHAVAAEAVRVGLVRGRRNMANGVWRREASDCAREPSVRELMHANPNGEWRRDGRSETPESYADYIAQHEVWGNTFDVALLALCIARRQSEERPVRLVVFSREGAHEHHPVGTDGKLCAKTRRANVRDSDMCIGIHGSHWWSAPPL